jgi:hypothetical protein
MPSRDLRTEPEPMAGPEGPDDIEVVLENVELLRRLEREFAGRVPRVTIVSAVAQAEHRMTAARITTFVPVLVERHTREALRIYEQSSNPRAST